MTHPTVTHRTRRLIASLERALRGLVHSNLFISLATMSVVVTTVILADLPLEPLPLFIVFAATLFVYTVNRFTDLEEDEENVPDRASFTKRYGRYLLALGIGLYVAAIAVAVVLGLPGAVYLLLPLAVALLYSVGGIKQVFLVKNLFVGFAWGVIPLGVGYYYGQLWTLEILVITGYVTAMITVAAVIFDVKDIEGDREEGIATVPNRLGTAATRRYAQLANVAIAAAVVAIVVGTSLSLEFLALLAMNGYVAGYIPFAHPDRTVLYYGFIVDGEHVFLAVVVVGLEWLVW
ncbi:4-hydroxybenzoate polyprenyltransferase [Halobiforma haloterrestris]|uniref:4-hydroxybenzoate polyprenyltransferase n=1 Tax=Natronobacterium haloterrestre TaxID=148448 RepID=A0A1I1IXV1_NATHA|nr:UbiA family prenyltransferase [Halobiforma haloterrestris]SFC40552.1 4-hydroxybenzoate polyprenyltransferase [Halobiforma haloterrestris]